MDEERAAMKVVLEDMGRAAKSAKAKMLSRPAAAPPAEAPIPAAAGPTLADLEQALKG